MTVNSPLETVPAAELGPQHIGQRIDLGPDRPLANGVLEQIEAAGGGDLRRLTIRRGAFTPVTVFARPDCPVALS